MDNHMLQKLLKQHLKQDETIEILWEAGGDQRIIRIKIAGQEVLYRDPLNQALSSQLIMLFDLPNTGETYAEGKAYLSLDETENIYINFDNYEYDIEDDITDIAVDNFQLERSNKLVKRFSNPFQREIGFDGDFTIKREKALFHWHIEKDNNKNIITELRSMESTISKKLQTLFTEIDGPYTIYFVGKLTKNEIFFFSIMREIIMLTENTLHSKKLLFPENEV